MLLFVVHFFEAFLPFGGEVGVVGFVDVTVGKAHVEVVEERLDLLGSLW